MLWSGCSIQGDWYKSNVLDECKKHCERLSKCNVIVTDGVRCTARQCPNIISKPSVHMKWKPGGWWGPYPNKRYDGSDGTLGHHQWTQAYCKDCYFAPENFKESLKSKIPAKWNFCLGFAIFTKQYSIFS